MKRTGEWVLAMGAGALGAVVAGFLIGGSGTPAAQAAGETVVQGMEFTDAAGRVYARINKQGGQSARLAFFNSQGQSLLELGLDTGGLPEIRFLSPKSRPNPKMIFRVFGPNESAQLVFRDNKNKDRLIMGLDPAKPTEDPFLVYFDKTGKKKSVFGDYP